jgi:hypothetical protein
VALAVAACRAGYSICFTNLVDMVRQLKAAETEAQRDVGFEALNHFDWFINAGTGKSRSLRRHPHCRAVQRHGHPFFFRRATPL